jgi:hypothetical protein
MQPGGGFVGGAAPQNNIEMANGLPQQNGGNLQMPEGWNEADVEDLRTMANMNNVAAPSS